MLALPGSFPWLLPDLFRPGKFSARWPFAWGPKLGKAQAGEAPSSQQQHKAINKGELGWRSDSLSPSLQLQLQNLIGVSLTIHITGYEIPP